MTDNDIVKALECCHLNGSCDGCPLNGSRFEVGNDCIEIITQSALDLINRQKDKIAELEAEIAKQYEQAKADILGNMSDGGTSCHWCIAQHRAEAIKEFAERLKEKSRMPLGTLYGRMIYEKDIDNLVREMTEDTQ